ncbi:GAF and ANTAR domain-containing protein [Ruania alba]|uniref:Two-component response regulator, AmiR/NasT family, consists of REC and RNA-binding antiterminator (ANTAR) domains n=1 Tax=Ruania alba TaxID=648782 RepID=A0A1H5D7W7_9MICO|nr:GAF and ANTAR domain-containing protein [Ruania alba]SED74937.1 Two-component response regulator, AmiR/NasT family, consists of REC and RNA-binding antiterminator (ANTAR) domains [Ruania alba]
MATTNHSLARERSLSMFEQLGELLYTGDDYGSAYHAICSATRVLVTGCDHASLMMREGDRWSTPAATDEIALRIDQIERAAGTGPCVDAIEDDAPQLAPDLNDPDAPWPRLRSLLLEQTPIRGMLGFRIVRQGRKVAALNLFSDRPNGFTDDGVNQAAILAAFSSVALQAAADRQDVITLRGGLTSNREIGKAIGLLMAYHRISDDAAFEMLRTTSNELNTKLATVAEQVVAGHVRQLGG